MKKFVVLEQGSETNYALAGKHKKQFSTDFSDAFRLNWKGDGNDRYADYFETEITWSEARSRLFEESRGSYEYYIFIDDDIDIASNTSKSVAEELRSTLDRFKPIHGSIPSTNWPRILGKYDGEAVGMRGGDLCVQIFSRGYAELVFPTWWSGSGRSMWYAQFLAHRLAPERSLFLNHLGAVNTKREAHQDRGLEQFTQGREISAVFRSALRMNNDKQAFSQWGNSRHNSKLIRYQTGNDHALNLTWEHIASVVNLEMLPDEVSTKARRRPKPGDN